MTARGGQRRDRDGPDGPPDLRARRRLDRAVPADRSSSANVSTGWQIDAYRFDAADAHPPDGRDRLAGGRRARSAGSVDSGCSTREGLWARYADPQRHCATILEQAVGGRGRRACIDGSVELLQELYAAPVDPDLLNAGHHRPARRPAHTVAVRVSPQNAATLTPIAVAAGIDMLVIQGTIVSAEHVQQRRRAAEPEELHRRPGRPGDRRRLQQLPDRDPPDAHRRGRRHRRLPGAARPPPPTRCWASTCRWPPPSPTPPRPGGPTSTRPAAGTCMSSPTATCTPARTWSRPSPAARTR